MRRHRRYKGHHSFKTHNHRYHALKDRLNTLASSHGIYRSRKGLFMGVCRGIAEHLELSVFWTRIIVLVLFLFTGFWPVGVIYILAGLLLKMEPVSALNTEKDQEFYDSYTRSRESAIQRIKRKYDTIERRIQRMEHTVTSREFDWK